MISGTLLSQAMQCLISAAFLTALLCEAEPLPYPQGLANLLLSLRSPSLDVPGLSELGSFRALSCTGRKDGAYPDYTTHCDTYYRCLGGSVFSYRCPEGTKFDQDTEDCLPETDVECPTQPLSTRRCHNQSDGFYPDYSSSCRSYYRCKTGRLFSTGECERGTVWDYATSSCWSGRGGSCLAPSCYGLSDGPHPMPGSRCAAYFTCKQGYRTDHLCPLGTSFDYMEKACISSSRSICYERVCENRANGNHAMPHAPCHAYFRCFNAALVKVEKCPIGYLFDGYECVKTGNFTCSTDSNGSCSDRPDGMYAADDRECRGFFLCRHKILVRSFKCSSGLVFNGEKCVDSQNYICSSRPRVPDCTNKRDGYYITDKHQCRSFYYCQNGAKLSEHNCPGNYVFNGKQCVDPILYTCNSRATTRASQTRRTRFTRSTTTACLNSPNSFHLSKSSDCSRFHQCVDGEKISDHVCPDGSVFSGSRCVTSDEYECPLQVNSKRCWRRNGHFRESFDYSSYFKCERGVKTKFKCPVNMKFNGLRCVLANHSKKPSVSILPAHLVGQRHSSSNSWQSLLSWRRLNDAFYFNANY